jgi:signal transduction histidine kinase
VATTSFKKGNNMNQENNDINQLIHDTRAPLNRISMQAELIKMVLENDMPKDKAIAAVNKIIDARQDCSKRLQDIAEFSHDD